MNQHNCLKIIERPSDFLKGVSSPIPFKSVCSDWSKHIEFFESQKVSDGDTDECVIFTAVDQSSFDSQMDVLMPSLPTPLIELFNTMGFMDVGLDGQVHFHSSPRYTGVLTGNGQNGNALTDPWDAMRKYGVVPFKDLPVTSSMIIAQYFAPIPQSLINKGQQFLAAIGGKNAIRYHWICNGQENIQAMIQALPQAPLCIGTPVCEPWDQVSPPVCSGQNSAHSTMCYGFSGSDALIYDHYQPAKKVLKNGYPIPFVLQGIVTPNPPPPAPIPPPDVITPTPNVPDTLDWLQKLIVWLQSLLQ